MDQVTSRTIWPRGSRARHATCARGSVSSPDPGKDRALASHFEEPHPSTTIIYPAISNERSAPLVEYYNHVRYHESLNNLTPVDVHFGRAETILAERQRIKRETIANRRLQ